MKLVNIAVRTNTYFKAKKKVWPKVSDDVVCKVWGQILNQVSNQVGFLQGGIMLHIRRDNES
jgi:hypothetical protein